MQGFLRFSLGPAPLSCQSLKITSIVIHATQVHAIPCDFLKISLCGTKHSKSIESILFFGQCHLRAKLKLLKLSAKQLKLNSGHSCIFKAEFRGIFIFQAEYRKIGQLKHNIEGGMYIKSWINVHLNLNPEWLYIWSWIKGNEYLNWFLLDVSSWSQIQDAGGYVVEAEYIQSCIFEAEYRRMYSSSWI